MKSYNRHFSQHLSLHILRINIQIWWIGFSLSHFIEERLESTFNLISPTGTTRDILKGEEHRCIIREAVAESLPIKIIENSNECFHRSLNRLRISFCMRSFGLGKGLLFSRKGTGKKYQRQRDDESEPHVCLL